MEQFIGFWDLTKEQQERLAADGMLNIRTFGKRQVLMNQDDDAGNVGVMLSGTAFLESMNQEDSDGFWIIMSRRRVLHGNAFRMWRAYATSFRVPAARSLF
ncbi:MAG: hypothetical protein ACLURV_13405 [Gallintestinimicrobium sp.]